MEYSKILSFIILLVSALVVFVNKYDSGIKTNDSNKVNVVIISLGSGNIVNAVTLIKSLVMFTSRVIDIYLFVDDNASAARFDKKFEKWPEQIKSKFKVKYLTAMFPIDNEVYWNMHFKKCYTLKLFLPELLHSLDAVIYLDSDTILFNDIAPLWDKFAEFNETQMIGVGSDAGWGTYVPDMEYPYYGNGINSGVMLLNLTRLRKFELRKQLESVYIKYKTKIQIVEQCMLNIIFSSKPEAIFDLNCAWNFMFPNCQNSTICQLENDDGVKILHGAGKVFEKNLPTRFKTIHKVFMKFDFYANRSIFSEIQAMFVENSQSECTAHHENFLKGLKN